MRWIDAAGHLARFLDPAGSAGTEVNAAWRLLADITGNELEDIFPRRAQKKMASESVYLLSSALNRLAGGEPIAYVLGRVGFHDIEVSVDKRALIPRPETEMLVEEVIAWCRQRCLSAPWILDLGTGTGCIAKALSKGIPASTIVAIDRSMETLELAKANLRHECTTGSVHLVASDWLTALRPGPRFDVVASNPPYISSDRLASLPSSVREWEPERALDGGWQGMEQLQAILSTAATHMKPQGLLAMEISPEQAEYVGRVLEKTDWGCHRIVDDLAGRARVVVAEGPCGRSGRGEESVCCAA